MIVQRNMRMCGLSATVSLTALRVTTNFSHERPGVRSPSPLEQQLPGCPRRHRWQADPDVHRDESFTLRGGMSSFEASPFDHHYGLEIEEATDELVRGRVPVREHLLQPVGLVHGGVHASIAEALASAQFDVFGDLAEHLHTGRGRLLRFVCPVMDGGVHPVHPVPVAGFVKVQQPQDEPGRQRSSWQR